MLLAIGTAETNVLVTEPYKIVFKYSLNGFT